MWGISEIINPVSRCGADMFKERCEALKINEVNKNNDKTDRRFFNFY